MYGDMRKLEKSVIELDIIKTAKAPKVTSKSFDP